MPPSHAPGHATKASSADHSVARRRMMCPFMQPLVRHSPSAGTYLDAWRHVVDGGIVRFERFGRDYDRRDFLEALQRRISARVAPEPNWRKLNPLYQIELARDAQELRDHQQWRRRLWGLNGHRWRTDVVQQRLGHLLTGSPE